MWNAFGVGSYFVILCEMFGCCRSQYIDAALNIEHCLFLCVCFASHLKRPQNLFSLMIFYFYVNFFSASTTKNKNESLLKFGSIVLHMGADVLVAHSHARKPNTG